MSYHCFQSSGGRFVSRLGGEPGRVVRERKQMQAAGRQGWGVGDLGDDGAARGPEPEQLALGGALDEVEDGNVCGRRPARRVARNRRQSGGEAHSAPSPCSSRRPRSHVKISPQERASDALRGRGFPRGAGLAGRAPATAGADVRRSNALPGSHGRRRSVRHGKASTLHHPVHPAMAKGCHLTAVRRGRR